jgi:hypothetical protein
MSEASFQKVSFKHCIDPAFVKFKTLLSQWFGQT